MTKSKMYEWIDNASYAQLLNKWRFAPTGDPFFSGEIGDYYSKILAKKRDEHENPVAVSKMVGWGE
jgi:hypothetical protein